MRRDVEATFMYRFDADDEQAVADYVAYGATEEQAVAQVVQDVFRRSHSDNCPACGSPQPHLHPAVQFEGEVQPCADAFHRQVTPQNTERRIAETDALLERIRAPRGLS